jgi:hypothetical protein
VSWAGKLSAILCREQIFRATLLTSYFSSGATAVSWAGKLSAICCREQTFCATLLTSYFSSGATAASKLSAIRCREQIFCVTLLTSYFSSGATAASKLGAIRCREQIFCVTLLTSYFSSGATAASWAGKLRAIRSSRDLVGFSPHNTTRFTPVSPLYKDIIKSNSTDKQRQVFWHLKKKILRYFPRHTPKGTLVCNRYNWTLPYPVCGLGGGGEDLDVSTLTLCIRRRT